MKQRTRDLISSASFLAFVAFFLFAAVNLDVFGAGGSRLGVAFLIVLCSTPMMTSAWFWRRRWKSWTCAACWLLALALFLTPWHPRKGFVQRLESIRQGMTVDQVEAVMGGCIRGMGAKWQTPDDPGPLVGFDNDAPDLDAEARARAAFDAYVPPEPPAAAVRDHYDGTIVYRWNDHDPEYDSDMVFVEFVQGRVVHSEFMSD